MELVGLSLTLRCILCMYMYMYMWSTVNVINQKAVADKIGKQNYY